MVCLVYELKMEALLNILPEDVLGNIISWASPWYAKECEWLGENPNMLRCTAGFATLTVSPSVLQAQH